MIPVSQPKLLFFNDVTLYVDHIPQQDSFSRLAGQHKLDLMEKEENKKKQRRVAEGGGGEE